jgi:hypothetical protein
MPSGVRFTGRLATGNGAQVAVTSLGNRIAPRISAEGQLSRLRSDGQSESSHSVKFAGNGR